MAKKIPAAAKAEAASGAGKYNATNASVAAGDLMSAGFSSGVAKTGAYAPYATTAGDRVRYEEAVTKMNADLFAAAQPDRATRYGAERTPGLDSRLVHTGGDISGKPYRPYTANKGGGKTGWYDGDTPHDPADSGSIAE